MITLLGAHPVAMRMSPGSLFAVGIQNPANLLCKLVEANVMPQAKRHGCLVAEESSFQNVLWSLVGEASCRVLWACPNLPK
eukprot:Skav221725  [mRNA]  locus=scaffold542:329883:331117:+ [translate_table: standard]